VGEPLKPGMNFTETGEVRPPRAGEWFRASNGGAEQARFDFTVTSFPILCCAIVSDDGSVLARWPVSDADVERVVAKWQARIDGLEVGHRRMQRAIMVQHWWMLACIPAAVLVLPLPVTLLGLAWAMRRCRRIRREVYGE
jgi:hypothetical protein